MKEVNWGSVIFILSKFYQKHGDFCMVQHQVLDGDIDDETSYYFQWSIVLSNRDVLSLNVDCMLPTAENTRWVETILSFLWGKVI